jgi:hypothetical protein
VSSDSFSEHRVNAVINDRQSRRASMRRASVLAIVILAVLSMSPTAQAAGTSGEFLLFSGVAEPDIGVAPNGDQVLVTGEGSFTVHPNSVSASGDFTHIDSAGNVFVAGTWTATQLISLDFYGCRFIPAEGVDLGDDSLCGGALKMMVVLNTPLGEVPAIMTIFCIIGLQAPASHDTLEGEGVTLNVPGVINFNHTVHGDNVFVRV